ncbi:MAG: DJ-1/PfpI family protein [Pseudorhodoplanes sp.]|nr:DJ-1/PfpI family protein [Pseudorhodoplanes sp.]
MSGRFLVNMVLVKDMVQLDLTGPFEVLARVPGWTVELVGASLDPVRTDRGLTILPTVTREAAQRPDLFVVPGGTGIDDAMVDPAWVQFARDQADAARHVFGICTGSLLLAAAGLLTGRRAGAHWQARDLLAHFGAIPSHDRMVVDGKYYTSGGVTSGIDMALRVVSDVAGKEIAQKIQLQIEYDPAPPFPGGTPFTSTPEIVEAVKQASMQRRAARERRVEQAVAVMRTAKAAQTQK